MGRRRRSRRGTGRRCAADGCRRLVQPGRVLCTSHARTGEGRDLEAAIGRIGRQIEQAFRDGGEGDEGERAALRQQEALATFRRRLERGEYGELFEGRLRAVMMQAAAERGLAAEIGALRVVMARLLTDPGLDAESQAWGVARVAGMTVRAMRVQRELGEWAGDPGRMELLRVMAELEGAREEQ